MPPNAPAFVRVYIIHSKSQYPAASAPAHKQQLNLPMYPSLSGFIHLYLIAFQIQILHYVLRVVEGFRLGESSGAGTPLPPSLLSSCAFEYASAVPSTSDNNKHDDWPPPIHPICGSNKEPCILTTKPWGGGGESKDVYSGTGLGNFACGGGKAAATK